MGKYLASLAFAMTLSAVGPPALASTPAATDEASATVVVQPVKSPVPGLRDEAAMVLVGTALIGLGAAVRRSA
jgi:hypothetical protein